MTPSQLLGQAVTGTATSQSRCKCPRSPSQGAGFTSLLSWAGPPETEPVTGIPVQPTEEKGVLLEEGEREASGAGGSGGRSEQGGVSA